MSEAAFPFFSFKLSAVIQRSFLQHTHSINRTSLCDYTHFHQAIDADIFVQFLHYKCISKVFCAHFHDIAAREGYKTQEIAHSETEMYSRKITAFELVIKNILVEQ